MKIEFQGRNCDVDARFMEHAQSRVEGLAQFTDRLKEVRVTLSTQKGEHRVEITCDVDGLVLRSETHSNDPLSSFDQALDKVQRQLVRYKSRLVHRHKRGRHRGAVRPAEAIAPVQEPKPEPEPEETPEIRIVRTKSHVLKPMTPEEAVLQMEMVGHDFFVFFNGEANRVGVVYKRKSGDYGLIESEIE